MRIVLSWLNKNVGLYRHFLARKVSELDVDRLRQDTDDCRILVDYGCQGFPQVALVYLEDTVAVAVIGKTQRQLGCLVEEIREEAVAPITHGYRERVGHFGQKMHIAGQTDLDRYFHVELHIAVKGQKTPEHGRDDHEKQIKQNRPCSGRLL